MVTETAIAYGHIAFEVWGAVFCMLAGGALYFTRKYDAKGADKLIMLLVVDFLLNINDALAYYYRGNTSDTGYVMVRISNFFVFLFGVLLTMAATNYLTHRIVRRGGKVHRGYLIAIYGLCLSDVFLLILSRIFGFFYDFDEYNRYYRLDSYWIINVTPLVAVAVLIVVTIRNLGFFSAREKITFLGFEILPPLGVLIQIGHYGMSFFIFFITVSIMMMFVAYEIEYSRQMADESVRLERERVRLLEKQHELDMERLRLYSSQIQPHFIYNSLSMIRSYLPEDSKARDLLNHFTAFLRGSIDHLTYTKCIDVKTELETVKEYLLLQQERFGEGLTVRDKIVDLDYTVPPFTIQILVENAIRHGIREKSDGQGNLWLKSYSKKDYHIIEVVDDGVGFNTDMLDEYAISYDREDDIIHIGEIGHDLKEDNKRQMHIGINNLQKRLKLMCDGTLEFLSTPGVGTRAIVKIPKK